MKFPKYELGRQQWRTDPQYEVWRKQPEVNEMDIEKWRSRDAKQTHERKQVVINRLHKELGIDISDLHSAVATNKCVMVEYAGESFLVKRIGDDWSPSLRKLAKLDSGLNFVGRSRLVRGEG